MSRPRIPRWLALAAVTAVGAVGACANLVNVERRTAAPAEVATLDQRSPWLKAHLRDGTVLILSAWRHDSLTREIVGTGQRQDVNRVVVDSGTLRLPVDSVALFETNVLSPSDAHSAITVMTGLSAAVTTYCALNPKACFGSCPTFYVTDAAGTALMAEGFSSSIAPALEATDLDALWTAHATSRDFTVRMTNEALETHVVRSVTVVAVPRAAGARIIADDAGVFHSATALVPPRACTADGADCLAALSAYDLAVHSSRADSTDLGTRELVELEFPAPGDGDVGVIVSTRQTLMSTFLFYQALAWLGTNATPWLARLTPDRIAAGSGEAGLGAILGRVDVLVEDRHGHWVAAGTVGETGPLATDTKIVVLPRSVAADAPLRVRIRSTRGMWRLDQVQLAKVAPAADAIRLDPVAVTSAGRPDARALALLLDATQPLVTFPGDDYELQYRLPGDPADLELFLEARGYYLEWMRQEWLAEEDPAKAARLFLDPRGALRELAPVYARQEAGMDSIFWGSRYVRR
ncbi:MAG: hypothetical protein WD771_11555 [Gemmatimonadaceae bacterium]